MSEDRWPAPKSLDKLHGLLWSSNIEAPSERDEKEGQYAPKCQGSQCRVKADALTKRMRERAKPGTQSVMDTYGVLILNQGVGPPARLNLPAVCRCSACPCAKVLLNRVADRAVFLRLLLHVFASFAFFAVAFY